MAGTPVRTLDFVGAAGAAGKTDGVEDGKVSGKGRKE